MVEPPIAMSPEVAAGTRGALAWLRLHAPLLALILAAAALRATALVAIYPGIWFSDTNDYVTEAATGTLSIIRVGGYALFVAPFWRAGSAGALIITQHLLGVGMVVLLYALLQRRGVPRALACLAVVPAALDAYLVDVEHMIMSETVFHAAVVGAIALLLWPERPGMAAAAGAGLLLGYAAVVRSVGMPFGVLFAVYLLVRQVGWRTVGAFALGWVVVVAAYVALFDIQHGHLGLTRYGGRFLYAQVAPFADCSRMPDVPPGERSLCPDPRHRLTRNEYMWSARSPIYNLPPGADGRAGDFARRVIRSWPLTYAHVVAGSFVHYFEPGHHTGRDDYSPTAWQFPMEPRHWKYPGYRGPIRPGRRHPRTVIRPNRYITRMVGRPHLHVTPSRLLHGYQQFAYSSGQVLLPCLLVVLAALGLRRGARRLRLDAALLAATSVSGLLVASALSLFDYRYQLGAVLLLPVAAALAGTALLRPATGTA